mgnify:CR=1 FL=1
MSTRLLFCTTGILLRRLVMDPDLKGVTHVIVDEIHERGMNEGILKHRERLFLPPNIVCTCSQCIADYVFADFLLIVLKDILPRRPDIRIVLMSATLNAKLFSSFFDGAPMCHIPVSFKLFICFIYL